MLDSKLIRDPVQKILRFGHVSINRSNKSIRLSFARKWLQLLIHDLTCIEWKLCVYGWRVPLQYPDHLFQPDSERSLFLPYALAWPNGQLPSTAKSWFLRVIVVLWSPWIGLVPLAKAKLYPEMHKLSFYSGGLPPFRLMWTLRGWIKAKVVSKQECFNCFPPW